MYRIIGADGREYGPITVEQLRQWISQGRVNAQTRVKREGAADWQLLGAIPEFAAAHAALTAPPPKTSALAVTSLVLGLIGLCGIPALVGLILGIVSLNRINRSQGRLNGKGLAIAGICVSAVMFLLSIPFLLGLLLPAFAKASLKADTLRCRSNVQQIEMGVMMFASSHTNQFPPAATWCNSVQTCVGNPEVFLCSQGDKSQLCHYAFNTNLDGASQSKVSPMTVMIFETDTGGWNLSGGPELLPVNPRHRQIIVGFADGHVELVSSNRFKQLRWTP